MNERIRELADQILPNEKEFHQGDPKEWGYFFSGEELEKFADLIVRECINVIGESRESRQTAMYYRHRIAEHFGIL